MLQIASGMYFRSGVPLHETLHRATVYSNGLHLGREPVQLPITTLRFSTGIAPFQPVTVEVWDRLEAERPDGQREFMVATSGEDLIADTMAVLAFALNTTWSTDRDLVRRLVPDTLSARPRRRPSNQLRRTFDPEVLLTDDALADAAAFSNQLLALHRPEYEKAIRAIRRVVDATVLIADDVSLAYTLFVAALESLATDWPATPASWDTYDARKRRLVDAALAGLAEEQAERIRDAVLRADALGLSRRFHAFTLDHVEASFYRREAADALRPISASALPHALTFAYQVRSRQVHALERLVPEMWEISDRSDTVPIDGRPVLSLEGLNRLCRHVIRRYVERAPTEHDGTFDYRKALPGILRMQLAPEYWIWQADRVDAGDGPALLNGFLEVLLPVLRGESSQLPVDLRDVLERIENRLPKEASAPKRAPLVGLYALWHRLLPEDFHRPDPEAILARFGGDLEQPSAAAFATRLILTGDVPWPTEELASFAAARGRQLRRGKAHPLPTGFDAALQLCLARRLAQEGHDQQASAALSRAVETTPGEERLLTLEQQIQAAAGTAELAALDIAALLLKAPDGATEANASDVEDQA